MLSSGLRFLCLGILGLLSLGGAFVAPQDGPEADLVLKVAYPKLHVEGESLLVSLRVEVKASKPILLDPWALTSTAFSVNGRALGQRQGKPTLTLDPGQILETTLDLAPALAASDQWARRDFRLSYHGCGNSEPQDVKYFSCPEKGINFMELPAEQLSDYQVILLTNQGEMWFELWPDVAPNHVRNFLDLCYSGFYDGTEFHRVIPGFMIQGGRAKPGTTAPRTVDAEYNSRKHVRGVLSAARLPNDDNSASSEFFVMHSRYPSLDGQYSAFGIMLEGETALDAIVLTGNRSFPPNQPKGYTPMTPQVIERALVVLGAKPEKR
ncbi:MAG: peptidylprolyl isomerase [Planctomycetes bacterium]|nr:peptidylprolyl isomerase [Planctomycetota bacterium]